MVELSNVRIPTASCHSSRTGTNDSVPLNVNAEHITYTKRSVAQMHSQIYSRICANPDCPIGKFTTPYGDKLYCSARCQRYMKRRRTRDRDVEWFAEDVAKKAGQDI